MNIPYGLKVIDGSNPSNYTTITPRISTIISAGQVTMPDALNGDGTYGVDIALPDSSIPRGDIGAMVFPIEHTYKITNVLYSSQHIGYMDDGISYYTHEKSNGQMTSWTAGDLTPGDADEFDNVAGMFPVAFWDIMGQSTLSNVRLFAGMCYLVYDVSETSYIKVYSIGSNGVSKVEYQITIKNYDYE